MAYRSPGAYARFVQTAGAVNNPGATRVMAIVGTGTMFYDSINETVGRTVGQTIDALEHENIWEIDSVTSKPLYQNTQIPGTIEYKEGIDFDVKEGKYIAWKIDAVAGGSPTVKIDVGRTPGSVDFETQVTALVDANYEYLVKDGKYKVEITYIDSALGAYRVIDEVTQETIGEYAISNDSTLEIIPGIKLTVAETFVPAKDAAGDAILDPDGNPIPSTVVGDYVMITTKQGKVVPSAPAVGEVFYVNYTYKKRDADLVPKVFFNYDDIVAEYGNYDVTASGKVINSLSLAAEIAMVNGVSPLVCVQAKSDGDYEMKAAIDKLRRPILGINKVNTIIPLTSSKTVGAHATTHVSDMSLPHNGKECMAYLSSAVGDSIQDIIETAKNRANERIVYLASASATKEIKDLRTGRVNVRKVPGSMLAVAVASLGLRNDPAEPLTNKIIAGFKDLGELYTESEMNLMAENGALVLKQSGNVIKVRHGITTSVIDVNSAEITLVQIKDYVIESARQVLGELYVGQKLKPTILADIQSSLVSILSQFQGQDIILGYGGVNVKRSSLDPRQVDVKFEIEAIYPLNYIDISFSFSGVN